MKAVRGLNCIFKFYNFTMQQSGVIWFTGLSGAGKTTLAQALYNDFKLQDKSVVMLDGDEIRKISNVTGFDEQSRKNHNLAVGQHAAELEKNGHWVIVAMISPYEQTRAQVKKVCANYIEIFVSTPIETCQKRDVKGLYKKALSGEIQEFTGVSAPYEIPINADITLDTSSQSIDKSLQKIKDYLKSL